MESMKIAVRAPNWVGDSILALPAMSTLKQNFPDAELWLVAHDWVKDLFSMSDLFTGVLPLSKKSGFKTVRDSAKNLRDCRFDLGLLFTNSFASAVVFYMAKIPQRWGYKKDGRGLLLTKGIPVPRRKNRRHQTQYYTDLLMGLGLREIPGNFSLKVSPAEKAEAEDWLKARHICGEEPVVILNPGAYYGSAKRWPPERYAQVASLFQEKNHAQVLIIGSEDEAPLAESISSLMKTPPHILTGKTSLCELAALLSLADLFITNDSGPMHMANALKTPLVALFGPTEPSITGPVRPPASVIHKGAPCWPCWYRECPFDHRCMLAISPEEVFEEGKRYL
jgi:heptosyltransferase-2